MTARLVDRVWEVLTPFSLQMREPESRYVALRFRLHPPQSAAIGIALSLLLAVWALRRRGEPLRRAGLDLLLIALTGPYGLAAVLLLPADRAYGVAGSPNRVGVAS